MRKGMLKNWRDYYKQGVKVNVERGVDKDFVRKIKN